MGRVHGALGRPPARALTQHAHVDLEGMLYLGLERCPHQQVLIFRGRLELRVLSDVDAGP